VTRINADQTVRARLLSEMREGRFSGCERLPRESVLAPLLGISRTQLRDSLALLEREGFISRRHGVGTVINRHVLSIQTRMDLEEEFLDMVRAAGYQPDVAFVKAYEMACDADIAQKLHIEPGAKVLRVSRLVTADGRPAIYCDDYIDWQKIKDTSYDEQSLLMPIFYFLTTYCGVEPVMDVTEVRPVIADRRLAEILAVAPGAPLLFMDEIDYDIEGTPAFCSAEYYIDGIIKHTVMRKKL
jgi:GntR family transcriptional regulator